MSDLVKRFNSDCISANIELQEKLTEKNRRIEQLERELVEAKHSADAGWHQYEHWNNRYLGAAIERDKLSDQLAAEKALADRLAAFLAKILVGPAFADEASELEDAYRKARGL